jgi:4-hydroxybenzoate polyprenyltransferase
MLFLGLTPTFSAIANGEFDPVRLSILTIIGFLVHIFTFVQNDYYDIAVDRKSKYVSNRPIVTGAINQKIALLIIIFSFIILLILTIFFVFSIYSIILLLIALTLISLYNKLSKCFFGMEYILALGVFSFSIFGALTITENLSNLALIISVFFFFQWLFSVGISANLKDVEFDSKLNIKTTPIAFGVKMSKNKLMIPFHFIFYAFTIKILHLTIIALILILGYSSPYVLGLPAPILSFIILVFISLYLTSKIFTTSSINRDKMLIFVGLQEGLSFLLIPFVVMSYLIENIGMVATILIIIMLIVWPIFWFRVLYGKKMVPLE